MVVNYCSGSSCVCTALMDVSEAGNLPGPLLAPAPETLEVQPTRGLLGSTPPAAAPRPPASPPLSETQRSTVLSVRGYIQTNVLY